MAAYIFHQIINLHPVERVKTYIISLNKNLTQTFNSVCKPFIDPPDTILKLLIVDKLEDKTPFLSS